MKKQFFTIFLILLMLGSNSLGESLTTYGGTFPQSNIGYQKFCDEHPNIQFIWSDADYYPASAFISALLTREFKCDLFTQRTDQADWKALMCKGYCVDLSSSKILTDTVNNMYPAISSQGILNDKLFAIPTQISFSYLRVNSDSWTRMGYSENEVPHTFSEFLDFLSLWCDRIEDAPERDIVAIAGWNDSNAPAAYVILLTELLINEIVMEKQYSDQELFFDAFELTELLNRCVIVGERLSKCENTSYSSTLFEQFSSKIWPESSSHIVYLRSNSNAPKLIKARVSMWAINSNSSNIELCIELLEKSATENNNPSKSDDLFIYQNGKPRENPNYESDKEYWENEKAIIISMLQNCELEANEQYILEEKLSSCEEALNRIESNKWLVSPEQLNSYHEMVTNLYFAPINLFDTSTEGYEIIKNLIEQFAYRSINANQFLQRLNSIVDMMRSEQGQ